jgi:hypothetical protein
VSTIWGRDVTDEVEMLRHLAAMHSAGDLSDVEYKAAKEAVLGPVPEGAKAGAVERHDEVPPSTGRSRPWILLVIAAGVLVSVVVAVLRLAGSDTTGEQAARSASVTPGPSDSSSAADENREERGVLRFRPVIEGPTDSAASSTETSPTTGGIPGPAAPDASSPVTEEQATARFATLTCSSDGAASVDRSEDYVAACSEDGQFKYLLGPAIIEGADVADASASTSETTGEWVVLVDFNATARAAWAQYTAAHVGENVAFVLGGRVISAPAITSAISGQTTITGDFSEGSARQLAEALSGD